MRVPFENYIKVHIAARKSADAIIDELRAMDLRVDTPTVLKLKEQMYLEQPEYFDDYNEPVDVDWLEHHDIDKMFGFLFDKQIRRGVDGIEGALKLFDDPMTYRLVTAMAFAGFDDTDIELIIQGQVDVNYTFEDFKQFLHYFFDVEGWNKKDKEMYVATVKNTDLVRPYKEALAGDKNKLLWKLKLAPNLDFEEMLRQISYDSFYKFKETVAHDPDIALKFAGMVEKITGRMEKLVEDRKSDEKAIGDVSFLFEEETREEVKSYSELKKEGEED